MCGEIAIVYDRDKAAADARLIASAPDLLEALHVARAELENHHAPGMLGVLHTIDQAIAKAEGKS